MAKCGITDVVKRLYGLIQDNDDCSSFR